MGLPEKQGLYDPANEHDACGVGFVVNIKGRKVPRHHPPRPADPGQPRPSRRGRRRSAGGRRRRLPDPDAGCAAARLGGRHGLSLPQPGRYAVAMCFLPQEIAARELRGRRSSSTSPPSRGRCSSAGATCRSTSPASAKRVLETMPVIRQAIVAAGPRSRTRTPSSASCSPSASRPATTSAALVEQKHDCPGCTEFYIAVLFDAHGGLQGPAAGAAGGELLPRPAQPADRVGAGAGASALLDQHVPVLEAGAPLPLHRPQRRDQHACAATSTG